MSGGTHWQKRRSIEMAWSVDYLHEIPVMYLLKICAPSCRTCYMTFDSFRI